MLHFCTLFDSNYLSRGLALYESLLKVNENFRLYIFAFDNISFDILTELQLTNVVTISLSDFETEELLHVKDKRTNVEYMWTCTSHIIKHVLDNFEVNMVTYLDADLLFYQKPSLLIDELNVAGNSVLITEHRYSPTRDQSAISGIYCVQFVTFKNDRYGLEALNWWKDRCTEWCYARSEDGKFGDQMYLDDWTTRFGKVHVLKHLGGGVAPWNVQQYNIFRSDGKLFGREISSNKIFEVVFYHFHRMKFYTNNKIELIFSYKLSKNIKNYIYRPYIKQLELTKSKISEINNSFDPHGSIPQRVYWKLPLKNILRRIKGIYNLVNNR